MQSDTSQSKNTLKKHERVCSKITIDRLFKGGHSRSVSAFPLRIVYLYDESDGQDTYQILVSVPKKCFKRAVKRNRVKRQIREAYRLNKHIIAETMKSHEGKSLTLAIIWLDTNLHTTAEITARVKGALYRIGERL